MHFKSFRYGKNFVLLSYSGVKSHALNNISSGSKANMEELDSGSYSMLSKLKASDKADSITLRNLQNLFSFSQAQESLLKAAGKIVTRLIELVTLAMNPITSDTGRKNDKEFFERPYQLDNSAKDKKLFTQTEQSK